MGTMTSLKMFKKLLLLSITGISLGFIIKSKLFKEIINLPLNTTEIEFKYIQLIVITFMLTLIITIFLNITLYKHYKKATPEIVSNNNDDSLLNKIISSKIGTFIKDIIGFFKNAFIETYEILFNAIGNENNFKLVLFLHYCLQFNESFPIIIKICEILPRSIICLVFFTELGFSSHLHYYWFSLTLLLIPLCFRFLVFVLTHTCEKFLPEFHSYLIISPPRESEKIVDGKLIKGTVRSYTLKPELVSKMDIRYFLNDLYHPTCLASACLKALEKPHKEIRLLSVYFYYTFTLLGWGYLIFKFCT